MININKMLYLLNKAKSLGLKEIDLYFDTEGRKFDYCMAKIGSLYLEQDWVSGDKVIINLHEERDSKPLYPHDPRLEPGGLWKNSDLKREDSGWGFFDKEYIEWYGPWDDFRVAKVAMELFDKVGLTRFNSNDAIMEYLNDRMENEENFPKCIKCDLTCYSIIKEPYGKMWKCPKCDIDQKEKT